MTCETLRDMPVWISWPSVLNSNSCSFPVLQGINTRCFTALQVASHLNYETTDSHYVSIRAVDSLGLFAVRRFKVEIVDINDIPKVRKIVFSHPKTQMCTFL